MKNQTVQRTFLQAVKSSLGVLVPPKGDKGKAPAALGLLVRGDVHTADGTVVFRH